MFEQTLLTHPASARKTGALAESFLAQSVAIGVLLVGPLLYTQGMPLIPLITAVIVAPPPLPQLPPVAQPAANAPSSGQRSDHRMFVPITIPKGPIRTTEVEVAPISTPTDVYVEVGIPGAPVGPVTALPVFTRAPLVEVAKPPVAAPVINPKPVPVGGDVLAAKLLKRVIPPYPVLARQTRIQGTVHLLGIVAKDGRVQNLRVIDGHPLLRQAALDAVSQWVYSPTILNGQPVEVEAPIDVNFTLR